MAERMKDLGELQAAAPKKEALTLEIERNRATKKIEVRIPETMTLKQVITQLQRKDEEENQLFNVSYTVKGYHLLDVLVNFHRALADIFGWANMKPADGFFSQPPFLVSVETGLNEVTQVPWGKVQIPSLEGYLETGLNPQARPPHFVLGGQIKFKYKGMVDEIMAVTRQFLKEQSIYRGKAIKVSWAWLREGERYDPTMHAPKFIDLSGHSVDDLILPAPTMRKLNVNLFHLIRHYDDLEQVGVPLRGGALLWGSYGTGKTLAEKAAGKLAVENGWTFIELDSIADLEQALRFAESYGRCVIAGEDLELVIKSNEMTLSTIRNLMDGVDTKSQRILTVLTTNHLGVIMEHDKSLLRHGRLAVIEIPTPGTDEAARLVRKYGLGLFHETADFEKMGEKLAGMIASTIRATVEQAKIWAVVRIGSPNIKGQVMEQDVLDAADDLRAHNKLLVNTKKRVARTMKMVVTPDAIKEYGFVDQEESSDGNDESGDDDE